MVDRAPWPALDSALPTWSFGSAHHIPVSASAARAWQALTDVRPEEVRLLGPLMLLRGYGARRALETRGRPLLDAMCDPGGFVRLGGEAGREVVLGTIGRFWSWRPDRVSAADAAAFAAFASPGWARGVMAFRVTPLGPDRCRVETETRVEATSPDAHRRFARYWRLIHFGSALIRRSWLQAIRRRAEAA